MDIVSLLRAAANEIERMRRDGAAALLDNARHYDVWRKQTMEMGLPVAEAPKDWEPIERLTNTGSPG